MILVSTVKVQRARYVAHVLGGPPNSHKHGPTVRFRNTECIYLKRFND